MAKLNIPPDQLKALGDLMNISDEQLGALLNALAGVSLSVESDLLEEEVAKKVDSVLPHPEKFLEALLALNVTFAHAEPPLDEFVDDVLEALEKSGQVGARDNRRSRAKDLLTKVLKVPAFRTATKAIHLKLDHERLFVHARILTDARAIYGPKVSEVPEAALITHTLKISYYQDGKMVDFYLALDEADIGELQEVLQRAKTKAGSLSEVFKSANIRVIRS